MGSRLLTALMGIWGNGLRGNERNKPSPRQETHEADGVNARKAPGNGGANTGEHREPLAHWERAAPFLQRLNKLVTGEVSVPLQVWFARKYGPFNQVAVLGCSDRDLLNNLLNCDPLLKVDDCRISSAAHVRAAERIDPGGDTAQKCRLLPIGPNMEDLPEDAYDAVVSGDMLSHAGHLDICFGNIRRALHPYGYFWFNGYTGPSRYQWSDTQMRLAGELLALVPKAWRLHGKVFRHDASELPGADGSGAAASQHIVAALTAHFEIVEKWPLGGTLLAPIFRSGCLDASMAGCPEGLEVLAAMFEAEQELIRDGVLPSDSHAFVAKPRPAPSTLMRAAFERRAGPVPEAALLGVRGKLGPWLHLNEVAAFESIRASDWVAPFPPLPLMHRTSGVPNDRSFAAHGCAILRALSAASKRPLSSYQDLLDFGSGSGRLARMFKGFEGHYTGADIDADLVAWVADNLPWVKAIKTEPGKPLPFASGRFDAVVSISVFTHMDEQNQFFFLGELRRVTRAGAALFLTVSGARVLERAEAS
ncbi:MAG: methyltransferase domain-containing protein, partial [Beijerinckiaceae bacterium]|nr:methyltransferase domain-containing protein [Beijerinckiaceae bacterium]